MDLVSKVENSLLKSISSMRLPYWLGLLGGYFFDALSFFSGKKFPVSLIRVNKIGATTQYDARQIHSVGFVPPYTLKEGLDQALKFEFEGLQSDGIVFESE